MREQFPRLFNSLSSSTDSWLQRVHENFRQLFTPMDFRASPANGAPIHLLGYERSEKPAWAQSYSLLTHAGLIGAIILIAMHPPIKPPQPPEPQPTISLSAPDFARMLRGDKPAQGTGGGGDRNPRPATAGNPLPTSLIQIVRPTLPTHETHILEVPPTIQDSNAPPVLTSTQDIGLAWKKDVTNSPGRGVGDSIGDGDGRGVGDKSGPGQGNSWDAGPYHAGGTRPMCAYCPDPQYTDTARESKLQGTVTMQVLVGPDGRAQRIQLVKGIGLGLDERAMEAVKGWKFVPARDSGRRPVAEWVTIEAIFRLF